MNERVHIRHTRTISLTFAFRTCLLCHCYGSSCFVIYPTVRNNTAKLFVSSPTLFFNLRTSEPSGQNAKRDVWAPLEKERKRERERELGLGHSNRGHPGSFCILYYILSVSPALLFLFLLIFFPFLFFISPIPISSSVNIWNSSVSRRYSSRAVAFDYIIDSCACRTVDIWILPILPNNRAMLYNKRETLAQIIN